MTQTLERQSAREPKKRSTRRFPLWKLCAFIGGAVLAFFISLSIATSAHMAVWLFLCPIASLSVLALVTEPRDRHLHPGKFILHLLSGVLVSVSLAAFMSESPEDAGEIAGKGMAVALMLGWIPIVLAFSLRKASRVRIAYLMVLLFSVPFAGLILFFWSIFGSKESLTDPLEETAPQG